MQLKTDKIYHGVAYYPEVWDKKEIDKDIELMRKEYDYRRKYLVDGLRKIGLECFEPKGAFYVFPCIKEFGMTSEAFATKLLEQEKVAVVPGNAFGDSGEGYIRISYAYSIDDLKKAVRRISSFISRLRG